MKSSSNYDKLCGQLRRMATTWGILELREAADVIELLTAIVKCYESVTDKVIEILPMKANLKGDK